MAFVLAFTAYAAKASEVFLNLAPFPACTSCLDENADSNNPNIIKDTEPEQANLSEDFAKINLEKSNGKTAVLDLYPIMPKQQFDAKTGDPLPLGKIENYYALLNEEDFIVVSQKIIQNLLWAYDYFYE